jgi:Uma2 family endonuclease
MRATLNDLARVSDKAELIGGRIVYLMPSGFLPGQVGGRIYRSLDDYCEAQDVGVACPDGTGFAVRELSSGRESFCPDAAYYVGDLPARRMGFITGTPTLAVEVRSENDYGRAAEAAMAAKRADYFEAGTLVVWDVDPEAEVIRVYRKDQPSEPRVYGRGEVAEAEPAVPAWRFEVDRAFRVRK